MHSAILAKCAYPTPIGYMGFPKSVCTSVNDVLCHGIPDNRPLQTGDAINIDVTCFKDGYHGDTSAMAVVPPQPGEQAEDLVHPEVARLIRRTRQSLLVAIN